MIKKAVGFVSIFSFLVMSTVLTGINYYIPESINLIAGTTQEINFNVPLKASFENEENIIVSSSSNEAVSENIKIDLAASNEITTLQEGQATAKISAFGIPLKTVSVNIVPQKKIIPGGTVIGVVMKTEGVLVLGTGNVKDANGQSTRPADGIVKSGDIILNCNGEEVYKKEELMDAIAHTKDGIIQLGIKRNDEIISVEVIPVVNELGEYRTGIWIRDSTQGLGTVTYIDQSDMTYGALGHGVYDVDTKKIMPVAEGNLILSEVTGIKKGEEGDPGEVSGKLNKNNIIGTVSRNTEQGIFGSININGLNEMKSEAMEIGVMSEVKEGEATILSDVLGNGVEEFAINIESVNRFGNSDKGLIIKITDEKLLDETGGIIQGMSGSPIIQNNKVIGAVTHVFVKDSTKGYGIFIENMLSASN